MEMVDLFLLMTLLCSKKQKELDFMELKQLRKKINLKDNIIQT